VNCWNSAATSVSASRQRFFDNFAFDRVEAAADDAFGGAAADVDHQAQLLRLGRLRMGHAQVDQARFFAAGDHFDGVAERGFGGHQERLRRGQLAHGIGRHRAHALRRDVADALAESGQAIERALLDFGVQPAFAFQAFGQAHGFAQPVDDAQLAERVARDHHVEAVGTQVDRGEHVAVLQRRRGGDGRAGAHPQILANSAACAECGAAPSCGDSLR
jgi:hypothetical protein